MAGVGERAPPVDAHTLGGGQRAPHAVAETHSRPFPQHAGMAAELRREMEDLQGPCELRDGLGRAAGMGCGSNGCAFGGGGSRREATEYCSHIALRVERPRVRREEHGESVGQQS